MLVRGSYFAAIFTTGSVSLDWAGGDIRHLLINGVRFKCDVKCECYLGLNFPLNDGAFREVRFNIVCAELCT